MEHFDVGEILDVALEMCPLWWLRVAVDCGNLDGVESGVGVEETVAVEGETVRLATAVAEHVVTVLAIVGDRGDLE